MTADTKIPQRAVMWRRITNESSFEEAQLRAAGNDVEITGLVLATENSAPLRVKYRIVCDKDWSTRLVEVRQTLDAVQKVLRLEKDTSGQWLRDGQAAPDLAGCTDVDLGISPSTNALPINRLRLPVGASADVRAAWVRFPDLTVTSAAQSYSRLSRSSYRYRSPASSFEAVIDVDGAGLPITYDGIWQRVADGAVADRDIDDGFALALISPRPAAELGEQAKAFDWLIGRWVGRVRDLDDDGTARESRGEWWFAWTLEGRAIQDVWIVPERTARSVPARPHAAYNRYGTSIRCFDRAAEKWRVTWINPATGAHNELTGGRQDNRIELLGESDGTPIRWTFNEIKPDSFIWRGERRLPNGAWHLDAQFDMRRSL